MPRRIDRYPSDSTDPTVRLTEKIRDLESRIRALEGARPLQNTAVSSGGVRIVDSAGVEIARIGEGSFSGDGGDSGIERLISLQAAGGGLRFLISAESGLVWPPTRAQWQPLIAPVGTGVQVTSGTFTSTHRVIYTQAADSVRARIQVGADAATTGEVRLESGGPHQTTVRSVPAGGVLEHRFDWHLGAVGIGIGAELSIDIQVRRLTGAGNITVYYPAPLMITDNLIIRASESGEIVP